MAHFLQSYIEALKVQIDDTLPPNLSGRTCLRENVSVCNCTNLLDSDCWCNETDFKNNRTLCDCELICRELWHDRNLTDYNMSFTCHPPQLNKAFAQLFVLAKSMSSTRLLMSWKEVMENLQHSIDFNLYLIVTRNPQEPLGYASPLGRDDLEAGLIQLCSLRLFKEPRIYMPFIYCMNLGYKKPLSNAIECALVHNLDFRQLNACVWSETGQILLEDSERETTNNMVSSLPTLIVDGRLYNPNAGKSPIELLTALCYLFDHPLRTFPWWVLGFVGCLLLSLAVVIFIVKDFSFRSIISCLRTSFSLGIVLSDDDDDNNENRTHVFPFNRSNDVTAIEGDEELTAATDANTNNNVNSRVSTSSDENEMTVN
jgi:hypothetical protein